jgi:hypothetical protein
VRCRERARVFAATALILAVAGARPLSADAVELRAGDDRLRLGGSLATWDVVRLHDDTPGERPSGLLTLRLDAVRTDRYRLFASLRGGFDGKIGNARGGNPFIAFDEVYQSKDVFVDLDEAYVEIYLRDVELHLGKQKIFWGQLDDLQPTDHVNPQDLTEFYFRPEAERTIGIPAARLLAYHGAWTFDFVWTPVFTAPRLPAREDRWFPPLLAIPETFDTPLGTLPIRTRYPDVDPPAHTLASSDVAFRVQRFHRGIEMSLAAFHGWDKLQSYDAEGTATVTPTGDPSAPAAVAADVAVVPARHRITVVGADLAVPLWLFALRAEAAWIHGRAFPLRLQQSLARDPRLLQTIGGAVERVARSGVGETVALPLGPAALEREAFQWGVGLDWFVNERVSRSLIGREWLAGTFFLVQLIETVIFDHDAAFIADGVENLFGATIRRTFADERLAVELKAAYEPRHGAYFVWPQLAYNLTGNLTALLEARVIGGASSSIIGQYRDHDGIRLGARWAF